MSPILKTLTETISTDTIYAQCTVMIIVHLTSHEYGPNTNFRPISLNSIFFASVCLASRLSTIYHAFAFLLFSIDLFVLIVIMYKTISLGKKLFLTAIFILITLFIIKFTFGLKGFIIFIYILLFINVICPYIFIRMQALKE